MIAGIPIAPRPLDELAARHGGALRNGAAGVVRRLATVARAQAGELAPLFALRYLDEAKLAIARGAFLLVDASLATRSEVAVLPAWFHEHAAYALAEMLELADAPEIDPVIGGECRIGQGVILAPRVRVGARVVIGPGAVIGAPGFGFAEGPDGRTRPIPQLGGVIIEDDVHIGALATIACGTIGPTILRRGAKLDAQVHVGHNCEIGEGTIIAAQTGLAGSVIVGRRVMMGGQVGVADHVRIGDGARIAAKSGVIGDVAAGQTVAGYPAVERHRWLRGLAELYRLAAGRAEPPPRVSVPVPPPSQVPTRRGSEAPPPPPSSAPAIPSSTSQGGSTRSAPASAPPATAPLGERLAPPPLNPAAIIRSLTPAEGTSGGAPFPRKEGSG